VIRESTTYPGTTEEVLQCRFEAQGFTIGRDLFLAFSSERSTPATRRSRPRTSRRSWGASPRSHRPGRCPLCNGHLPGAPRLELPRGRDCEATGDQRLLVTAGRGTLTGASCCADQNGLLAATGSAHRRAAARCPVETELMQTVGRRNRRVHDAGTLVADITRL
jgi:hypothetical protein